MIITDDKVNSVEMNDADAILFVEFQKRYAFMKMLESIDAFAIRNGSITVHFDNLGRIVKIDKHEAFKVNEP